MDFDLRYSYTEPDLLVLGKPELVQVLRAIKAIQFHQYQILLTTKDSDNLGGCTANPSQSGLKMHTQSGSWSSLPALQHALLKVILLSPLHMCH